MYELCVLSGHHAYALRVFDEHEELRKSLAAAVHARLLRSSSPRAPSGPDAEERLAKLPRVLELMGRHGVLPRAATCERLLGACTPPARRDRRAGEEHREQRRPRAAAAARARRLEEGESRRRPLVSQF